MSSLQDGRLLLDNTSYLCVQSKPGHEALREGSPYFSSCSNVLFNPDFTPH